MKVSTAQRASFRKKPTRIEHSRTYFKDNKNPRVVLPVRMVWESTDSLGRERRKVILDTQSFDGDTMEEAEQAMVDWIEVNNIVEADFDKAQ